MAGALKSLISIVLPKRTPPTGLSFPNDFNPGATGSVLPLPTYREHLDDIFTDRSSLDSRDLLKKLFTHDPDVSAALHAYLTLGNTTPRFLVRGPDGTIDRDGQKLLLQAISAMTTRSDYSKGFQFKQSLRSIAEEMRYMVLLRGGIASELIIDKTMTPSEFRHVDVATLYWQEPTPDVRIPIQYPKVGGTPITLDIPTLFVSFFRKDPTTFFPYSIFVSSVNTIASRAQIVNDLYRIMKITGYPRLDVKVLEEVVLKNAPAQVKNDPEQLKAWMTSRLAEISGAITNMSADQALVHWDSVEFSIVNEKQPGMAVDISKVIELFNSQNQAALKVMATVIGRGTSGVNTASVEARLFALSAEEINAPIAELWSHMFSMIIRILGSQSAVEVWFDHVELRPDLELEPQRVMKQSRMLELLSLGIIDDDEFGMEMFGHIRPDAAPILSGTNFLTITQVNVDTQNATPNGDPLGRSLAPPGSKSAKSNAVKKTAAEMAAAMVAQYGK